MMDVIVSGEAPAAIGPYSQAIRAGNSVYCSGQIALDPETQCLAGTTVAEQTAQVLRNLEAVLKAAGLGLDQVVKTTVFLADLGTFPEMNAVYGRIFGQHKPARACIEVAGIPKGALVEIDCIAHCPQSAD